MACGGFGGWGEDDFRELVGLAQAGGEGDAADFSCGLIFLPTGAGKVAARHTFDRERARFSHHHRAAGQFIPEMIKRGREFRGAQNVIGEDIFQEIEPEERELRQDASLVGYRRGHDDVEGREAIRSHDKQAVAQIIDIAHLAARQRRDARKICLSNDFWCRTRVHDSGAPDKVFSILSHRSPMSMRPENNSGEENLVAAIVSFNERKNGAKEFSPRRPKYYFC